ncbi:MAG: hypothetical protein GKR89_33020 [Candidatus Latescibacteria bacterium]|nr:hypothetical protein [Candidatus Latescibacterota bacterium]
MESDFEATNLDRAERLANRDATPTEQKPDLEFNFEATKFERSWTVDALQGFYQDGWFTEVLYRVKSGKEATVYCCRANPETGYDLVAAKIYRHRRLRSMQNYAAYQTGRTITTDKRLQRAMKKKTATGKETEDNAWLAHEFSTMELLHFKGADVPRPLAPGANSMLMEFVGDSAQAGPTLHEVELDPETAQIFFHRLIDNVSLMLGNHYIHGDLSAYNILYWQDDFKIIDFPQAVDPMHNPSAFSILARDIERLCQYFGRFGVEAHAMDITENLWKRYQRGELYR